MVVGKPATIFYFYKKVNAMKFLILWLGLFLLGPIALGQNDTTNQLDQQGRRKGYWIKYYPNGQIQYEGYFAENLPVGTLKRYYAEGGIKATLTRHPDSLLVHGEIFDEKGTLRAQGNYLNQMKEGLWYFFGTNHELVLSVTYREDRLHGVASRYFSNGQALEQTNWSQNKLQGLQILFDEKGHKKAEINYFANQMHGPYRVFGPSGFMEVNGTYKKDLKDGKWQYFKPDGQLDYELIYQEGLLLNPEVMNQLQQESFKNYEENKLLLKDPMKYLNDPGSYFKN